MPLCVIAPAAVADIESILTWTEMEFGEKARWRYEALLTRAIIDIAVQPERAGSTGRPEIAPSARTYHLTYSRKRVAGRIGQVRQPRHFVLYRLRVDGIVEIGRVLHDSMDLNRHLPDEYRRETRAE
jgi:toxin ParE1/3/4